MRTFLLALLVSQTAAGSADGGIEASEPAVVWRLTKPTLVPAGRYMSEHSYQVLDAELKRLQTAATKQPEPIPVQGYLIGMAVVGAVCLIGGAVGGFVLAKELK